MTMITPSYLGETIEYSSLHACRSTLEDPTTRYTPLLHAPLPGGPASLRYLAGLNATVTEQAAMIAYNNDFKLMTVLSLMAIPMVLLLRKGAVTTKPIHIE